MHVPLRFTAFDYSLVFSILSIIRQLSVLCIPIVLLISKTKRS